MKSFTDVSQSKKLAEILPIDSADMYYRDWKRDTKNIRIAHVGTADKSDLPCWSLAALLSVLPGYFYDETGRKSFGLDKGDQTYGVFYETKNAFIQTVADNPVDACFKMIIKLHELKML